MLLAVIALVVALAIALTWRHTWAPAVGALVGVVIALGAGVARVEDAEHATRDLWRPLIVIGSIMVTTACAAELGVFARLASWIEPRTRGPVRHAFRFVFVISALTAALLSNDAAILLVTPVVITLLKTVYPKRNPKFVAPFALAVFVAAGVAPLPTGNPMNLVVSARAGIDLNTYAVHMIPVALAGWLVAYAVLAWCFRDVLADEAPALGEAPPRMPLSGHAKLVMLVTVASIATYPVLAALGLPLWPVAAIAALLCTAVASHRGVQLRAIVGGVSWELVPFLFGVLVLATALARAGLTGALAQLYATSDAPLALIGGVAAAGSALINNHPMALLHSLALAGAPDDHVLAALIGGDLGPRLLPIGSLAGLLWLHALRQQGVAMPLRTFVRVGVLVTLPSLIVSLGVLAILP
ncbi:MAG TPA: ArsB/NhaD family transporter [Kofleriaceae bacterium]|nr:ArsB/NhaD family transporter [Kofleriaceae bacterium]